MSPVSRVICFLVLGFSWIAPAASAQSDPAPPAEEQDPLADLEWKLGPTEATVGKMARITITDEYRALGSAATQKLMNRYGNVVDGSEVALVMPKAVRTWFVIFEWDQCGYVDDSDREDLDAAKILKGMKDNEPESNKKLISMGMSAQTILRWAVEPRYDEATNNLEWAFVFASEGVETVNLNTRRLGRKGMMKVTLVCDPSALDATIPPFRTLMTGFSYLPEDAYGSYQEGDRTADFTLGAIVGGGALAIAAKVGLFKKFWKLIVFGVLGIGAAIGKLLKRGKRAAGPGASGSTPT